MKKHKFTYAERYSVWMNHGGRCWICLKPLTLEEMQVEHVLPETLAEDNQKLQSIINLYSLPNTFKINGFENWLPSHGPCNQLKKDTIMLFVPRIRLILETLIRNEPEVKRTADDLKKNIKKQKLIANVAVALEENKISPEDLQSLINNLNDAPPKQGILDARKFIHLDNGYWLHEKDVAAQGLCQCERDACVGHQEKLYCFWAKSLSEWVLRKRLYWRCYDESVPCPQCGETHKRGHIGKNGVCRRP